MADPPWIIPQSARSSLMSYRSAGGHGREDNRMSPGGTVVVQNPLMIEQAIHNSFQNVKSYFLVVVSADNSVEYFAGPECITQKDISGIFDLNQFLHSQRPRGAGSGFPVLNSTLSHAGGQRGDSKRTCYRDGSLVSDSSKPRKTARRRGRHPEDGSPHTLKICIGNEKRVWEFYIQRFKGIQQLACKLIAKAWIKAVAPKKQSTHPYTGDRIPDWWPKLPLDGGKMVRHKEPDHLLKNERLHLLAHILRLIVEPNHSQYPDIEKLNLGVSKLENITNDSLTTFFAENGNKAKGPLQEIFHVARMEEQYRKGEISGNTDVQLMPADPEDEDWYPEENTLHPASNQDSTPALAGPTAIPNLRPQTPHYSQAAMAAPLGPDYPIPMDTDGIQDNYGSNRRAFVYNVSGTEYTTGGPQVPLYSRNSSAGPSRQQMTTIGSPRLFFSQSPLPRPHLRPQAETSGNAADYVPHMDVQYRQHQYSAPKY